MTAMRPFLRRARLLRLAFLLITAAAAHAQRSAEKDTPPAPLMVNEGKPIAFPFTCTPEDMMTAGLTCTKEQPCPIYLEISAAGGVGERVFAAGNLHAESSTLASVLLLSEDRGKTWREAFARVPQATLEQIRFFDFATGWISGQVLEPTPRDPFFLITTDGGKSWRRRPVWEDSRPGIVEEWRFLNAREGDVWIDRQRSADDGLRYEHYQTQNGGDTWTLRQVSENPIPRGRTLAPLEEAAWRVRADAATQAYVIERNAAGGWLPVASFLIQAGFCAPPELSFEQTPEPEPTAPAVEAVEEFRIGGPPRSKPKPKPNPRTPPR